MGIFSRTRDIIAANVTDLLDKAEDPAKMIRMIILEMEETLVEVRASAARTIADQKEMRRQIAKLDRLQDELDREGRAGAVARTARTSPRRRWSRSRRRPTWPSSSRPRSRCSTTRCARRGRHRQAADQAARGAHPPERDHDPDGERPEPLRGCARCMPARRSRTPSRASTCSSAAPTSPKATPRRSALARRRDAGRGDRRASRQRQGRCRARGAEGQAGPPHQWRRSREEGGLSRWRT